MKVKSVNVCLYNSSMYEIPHCVVKMVVYTIVFQCMRLILTSKLQLYYHLLHIYILIYSALMDLHPLKYTYIHIYTYRRAYFSLISTNFSPPRRATLAHIYEIAIILTVSTLRHLVAS